MRFFVKYMLFLLHGVTKAAFLCYRQLFLLSTACFFVKYTFFLLHGVTKAAFFVLQAAFLLHSRLAYFVKQKEL